MGRDDLGGGGVHRGQVDGVAHRAVEENVGDLLGDLDADRLLGLGGGGGNVGSEHDVGSGTKLAVLGEGLGLENIEAGGADLAALKGGNEGLLVDDAAAGAIDDADALLALREGGLVDHVVGLVGQRHVDRDVVGGSQKGVERYGLHLHGGGASGREIGIVSEDLHAEGLGALGDLAADTAEADDADVLPEQLDAAERLAIPVAGLHGCRALRDRTGAAEDVGKGELGGRDRVATRGIHDDDAALGGGINIHVVHADAGAADDFQQRRGGENVAADLGLRADGDRVNIFDQLQHLRRSGAVGLDDFKARLLTQVGNALW